MGSKTLLSSRGLYWVWFPPWVTFKIRLVESTAEFRQEHGAGLWGARRCNPHEDCTGYDASKHLFMEVRTGFRKEFRLGSPERRTESVAVSGVRAMLVKGLGATFFLTGQYWVWFRVPLQGETRLGLRTRPVSPERRTNSVAVRGVRAMLVKGVGSHHLLTEQYWVWFRVPLQGKARLGLRIRPGPRGWAKRAEKRYGAPARVLGRLNRRP